MKNVYDLIIIGGGPMGIATAIEAKKAKLNALILEKGVLVNSLYHFPDHMTFFSTSKRLEIGNVPFMSLNDKPNRDEALEYYRRVIEFWKLDIQLHEPVLQVFNRQNHFEIETNKSKYVAKYVVVATGFYSKNNVLNVPGDQLPKVSYYYQNPHAFIKQRVAVIGAGNSACQVALDLFHKDIEVTMVVRTSEIKETVKYWIKPNIENRIKEGSIKAFFNTTVQEITSDKLILKREDEVIEIANDFVLAMIGYQPDYDFLAKIGITNCNDEFLTPNYDSVQQTNIQDVYLAGVVCGGLKTNRFMIEDSIVHAEYIIQDILRKEMETASV